MKITIAPTQPAGNHSSECVDCTVTIEHPHDDLDAEHVARLTAQAMIAYGFNVNSVAKCFNSDLQSDLSVATSPTA